MGGENKTVWLVATNGANRRHIGRFVRSKGFGVLEIGNTQDFERALSNGASASLALIDLSGFTSAIFEKICRLRELDVPFVLISSREECSRAQAAGRLHGAAQTLTKPLSKRLLEAILRGLAGEQAWPFWQR